MYKVLMMAISNIMIKGIITKLSNLKGNLNKKYPNNPKSYTYRIL